MYTIGLDLAVQAAHKAVVLDEQGRFITPVLPLHTRPRELDQLLTRARNGEQEAAVQVVMEPTGMAWFPVAVYLVRHDVTVYLVNSQEVADLRRSYQRHAQSAIGSMLVCSPASLWSIPRSCTAYTYPKLGLWPVSEAVSNWIGSVHRLPRSTTACRRSIASPGPAWMSTSKPSRLGLRPGFRARTLVRSLSCACSRSCADSRAVGAQWRSRRECGRMG